MTIERAMRSFVIPTQAGIHLRVGSIWKAKMDPGLRRDDDFSCVGLAFE